MRSDNNRRLARLVVVGSAARESESVNGVGRRATILVRARDDWAQYDRIAAVDARA